MGEAEPTWKDYAQAFSDVVEALDRVDQFMREQHFTTLDLFRGETGVREVLTSADGPKLMYMISPCLCPKP